MKKPLICASLACACAFALQAETNDWFKAIGSSASASSYASENGTWDTNTYVQAGGEVTWDGTAFTFDLEDSEYITFNATSGTSPDTNTVTRVEVKGVFTPVSSELPSDSDMNTRLAQVGFVVSTNGLGTGYTYKAWYGAGWVALSNGSVTPDGTDTETDLIVEFDYSGRDNAMKNYVSFIIKSSGTEHPLTDGSATKFEMTSTAGAASNQVAGVSCYGSGTISKADGAVEIGIASVNNIKYPSIAAAVAVASAGSVKTVDVLRETNEDVTLADGITIADADGRATGTITVPSGNHVTIATEDANFTKEAVVGASGSYDISLKVSAANADDVTVSLSSGVPATKEIASKTLDTANNKITVNLQTKGTVLTAANPGGNKPLNASEAKLRDFIAKDSVLSNLDASAEVSTASITTALQANGGNGIPKWESYVLGVAPTDSIKPVTAPGGDTDTAKITLAIPAINTANYSGDYSVSYSAGGETSNDPSAIKAPIATGVYEMKATLTPVVATP